MLSDLVMTAEPHADFSSSCSSLVQLSQIPLRDASASVSSNFDLDTDDTDSSLIKTHNKLCIALFSVTQCNIMMLKKDAHGTN